MLVVPPQPAALPRRRLRVRAMRSLVCALAWTLGGCASGASPAEVDLIVEVLALEEGMTVADVGAGDGDFTVELARRLGGSGRVIATEIEQDKVDKIAERAAAEELDNVTALLGDQATTGLAAGCCDAILLRLVYHHFQNPVPMRAGLRAALRPGGRIAVIDILPQSAWPELQGVPDRGGHGIPAEQLLAEMTGDGFEVVDRHDGWNDNDERFCIVFRVRKQEAAPAPAGR